MRKPNSLSPRRVAIRSHRRRVSGLWRQRPAFGILLGIVQITLLAFGQSASAEGFLQQPPSEPASEPAETPDQPAVSEAERIARAQRRIDDAEKQIQQIADGLNNPDSEYHQAEQSFRQLDEMLDETKQAVKTLKDEGVAQSVIATAEQDLEHFEKRWALAKERFELAIDGRRTSQAELAALEQKLQEDRAEMARLLPVPKQAEPAAAKEANGAAPPEGASPRATPNAPPAEDQTKPTGGFPPEAQGPISPPRLAAPPKAPPGTADQTAEPLPEGGLNNEEIAAAKRTATTHEAALKDTETHARSIQSRINALREGISAQRKLLSTAQQQQDNSHETKRVLNEELQARWGAGATWAELRDLREKITETDKRIAATRDEIRTRNDRLADMQAELSDLQSDQVAVTKEVERKRVMAETARRRLAELSNPFSPANLLQWLLDHGPRILGIMLGMLALLTVARVLERKLVPVIARHSRGAAGSVEDRENRARTLLGVFHNAVRIVVVVGGSLMLLAELGMNIVPLITAAGVVGLAIAFGAQNLIRDYFYGFIILLENQYGINDVVKVGGISGLVERITLRITVLRDLEGVVHFVPHGEAKTVSNLTHGWSRALFDIGIAYKESPDKAMKVLVDLGRELRRDPQFSPVILDDPEMLGVDQLGESAVVIKFLIKTRPLKQWEVKREMLRRIKNKFDELGIEIPFPQRTVYHRYPPADGDDAKAARLPKWDEESYANR